MTVIASLRHPRVLEAVKLHHARGRREAGLMLLDGPNVVSAAIAAGIEIKTLFLLSGSTMSAPSTAADTYLVNEQILKKVSETPHPRGPVAVAAVPEEPPLTSPMVVLWGVSEPGNLGAIIRSAAAFGWSVAIGPESADPWSPKALRAAAGAHFSTAVGSITESDLDGIRLVASVPTGGPPPERITMDARPLGLIVGSEAHGVPHQVIERAETLVSLPMATHMESLNAAVAAGILMYEISRSRSTTDD